MRPFSLHAAAVAVSLAAIAPAVGADVVTVAVAANFTAPLGRLGEAFSAATGHTLRVSAGATGKFYAQVVAGAPFDVLLAADVRTPSRLVAEGHAVAGSQFTYAIGKLVLWSAQPGLVDDQGAVLATDRFAHLAVANPKTAPYGLAAFEVLRARQLESTVAPRVVTGESIAQAYQFVVTRNAELGFLALSQVVLPGQPVPGSMWLVPASLYSEIRQDAVLLKAGQRNAAALALLDYLKSAPARAVIQSYGYGP